MINVYLYKYFLDYDSKDKLHREIKELFVNLIKNYNLDLFGYFKVDIYENKKYGCILEINKIYGDNTEFIDLKIILHRKTTFYLVMDEYYYFDLKDILYRNNKYLINIENIDNLDKYIEYGEINYDN